MTNIDPQVPTTAGNRHTPVRRSTFELRGVHCLGCAGAVERVLREQLHVTDVRLDWKKDLVRVGYDPARVGPEDIEAVIAQTGCDCSPTEVEEAYRVLMVWAYDRTGESMLLAMLMHATFSASMIILEPLGLAVVPDLTWALVLAAALWVVVGVVAVANGGHLSRQPLRGRVV
jgi:copper chaperone CopZ